MVETMGIPPETSLTETVALKEEPSVPIIPSEETQFTPWHVAFKVSFPTQRLGVTFIQAKEPDTGNGYYAMEVHQILRDASGGKGACELYNSLLRPDQQQFTIRKGLRVTHINGFSLERIGFQDCVGRLRATTERPLKLRFISLEHGAVDRREAANSYVAERIFREKAAAMSSALSLNSSSPLPSGGRRALSRTMSRDSFSSMGTMMIDLRSEDGGTDRFESERGDNNGDMDSDATTSSLVSSRSNRPRLKKAASQDQSSRSRPGKAMGEIRLRRRGSTDTDTSVASRSSRRTEPLTRPKSKKEQDMPGFSTSRRSADCSDSEAKPQIKDEESRLADPVSEEKERTSQVKSPKPLKRALSSRTQKQNSTSPSPTSATEDGAFDQRDSAEEDPVPKRKIKEIRRRLPRKRSEEGQKEQSLPSAIPQTVLPLAPTQTVLPPAPVYETPAANYSTVAAPMQSVLAPGAQQPVSVYSNVSSLPVSLPPSHGPAFAHGALPVQETMLSTHSIQQPLPNQWQHLPTVPNASPYPQSYQGYPSQYSERYPPPENGQRQRESSKMDAEERKRAKSGPSDPWRQDPQMWWTLGMGFSIGLGMTLLILITLRGHALRSL